MNIEYDIDADQIDGARSYQEDAFIVSRLDNTPAGLSSALIIMADGMGGHAAGNVASDAVASTFEKDFKPKCPPQNTHKALNQSLLRANKKISSLVAKNPALTGMGCTMVSAYLEGDDLWWISVGDSHLYLIRDKSIIKQNADHSYGAFLDMMTEQGEDMEDITGMSRNMLMSAMTGAEISSIDCPDEPLKIQPGDRIIVASDGLNTIGLGAIMQYSIWSNTPKDCVNALLKAVEDVNRVKQDNTTVIVIDVKDSDEKPKDQLENIALIPETASAQIKPQKRLNDLVIEEEDDDNDDESSGIVLKLIIIIALCIVTYFFWASGLVGAGLSKASEFITKDIDINNPSHMSMSAPAPAATTQKSASISPQKSDDIAFQNQLSTPSNSVKTIKKVTQKITLWPFSDRLKNGSKSPLMIKIPSGSFRMGGVSNFVSPDETPRHTVTLKAFAISQFEITYAEYEMFAKANNKKLPNNKGRNKKTSPVTQVSWKDAVEYTQWLSQQTGAKYRLPTESEWEYAARAGSTNSFWWGTNKGSSNAQCFDCSSEFNPKNPVKIGSFKSNGFSLYDVHGNVYEWVSDCYHGHYRNAPNDGSSWEGGDCSVRIARGGSYASPASSMRVENRETFKNGQSRDHIGIRLVREL